MVYKNLNIPATLVHSVNGKKYKLNGLLLSININESTNVKTCSMDFNGKIGNNIPLEEVYLNEGIVDALKKAKAGAKKLWGKIVSVVKIVGNFILPKDADGNEIPELINTPVNVAHMELSPAIKMYPSNATLEVCDNFGVSMSSNVVNSEEELYAEMDSKEREEANKRFGLIMKEYATSDDMLVESIRKVDSKYYKSVNEMLSLPLNKKTLNEATLGNVKHTNKKVIDNFGKELAISSIYGDRYTASTLCTFISKSLKHQIKRSLGVAPLPIIIWGAPGIGKSTIICEAARMLKNTSNLDLDQINMNCSGIGEQDFDLPDVLQNKMGMKITASIPQSWLPVYDATGILGTYGRKALKEVDDFYNSGLFRHILFSDENGKMLSSDNVPVLPGAEGYEDYIDHSTPKNGGILFFDEFTRLKTKHLVEVFMALCGDRVFKHYTLASKWAIVCAANRLYDNNKENDDTDFWELWDAAAISRYNCVTYVPTKEEWLDWARRPNQKNKNRRNIDIAIIKFIENMPDAVWYAAIDSEGMLDTNDPLWPVANKIINGQELNDEEYKKWQEYVLDHLKDKPMWNSRDWERKTNAEYILGLMDDLFEDYPELLDKCYVPVDDEYRTGAKKGMTYTVYELDYNALSQSLDKLPKKVWETWANEIVATADAWGNIGKDGEKVFSRSEKMFIKNNRIAFIDKYLQVVIGLTLDTAKMPFRKYTEWISNKNFDKSAIRSIWRDGRATYAPGANVHDYDDDIMFNDKTAYRLFPAIAWKSSQDQAQGTIRKVIETTSGLLIDAVEADMDVITRACKDQGIDMENPVVNLDSNTIKKYMGRYSFTLCDENGNALTEDNKVLKICAFTGDKTYEQLEEKDKKLLQLAIFTLMYSKVARDLANVAMWVGKVGIQMCQKTLSLPVSGTNKETAGTLINTFWDKICKNQSDIISFFTTYSHLTPIGPALIIGKRLGSYLLKSQQYQNK